MGTFECDRFISCKLRIIVSIKLRHNTNPTLIKIQSEGCNVDLENEARLTAYDYAYSVAVQDHLKGNRARVCCWICMTENYILYRNITNTI